MSVVNTKQHLLTEALESGFPDENTLPPMSDEEIRKYVHRLINAACKHIVEKFRRGNAVYVIDPGSGKKGLLNNSYSRSMMKSEAQHYCQSIYEMD